ncbi:MAG: hypothetical protein ACE5HL_00765 [Terriglobia bacterium]
MGFLKKLFGASAPDGPEQLTSASVGKLLAELSCGSNPGILDMLIEELPSKNRADAFLALASLSLFAWIRASQSESLQLDLASQKEIYHSFASFLVVQYLQQFGGSEDPNAIVYEITSNARGLLDVWNNSQGKEPLPHWYVAKAVWFMLQEDPDRPDPVQIMALTELLSSETLGFLEFVRDIQGYIIKQGGAT